MGKTMLFSVARRRKENSHPWQDGYFLQTKNKQKDFERGVPFETPEIVQKPASSFIILF